MSTTLRVIHQPTGAVIAEGPRGWGITPFEGNLYIRKKYLREGHFKANFIPGLCFYKFLYVWMNWIAPDGTTARGLGWLYFLPNPLFPFIWFRIGIPRYHPDILIDEIRSS